MLTGSSPFHGSDEEDLFREIMVSPVKYPNSLSDTAKSFVKCLLERDVTKRLGSVTSPFGSIKKHSFFLNKIDWDRLENGTLEPPFKPRVKSPIDLAYIDTEFTLDAPVLSKMDGKLLSTIDEDIFRGFSFVNES